MDISPRRVIGTCSICYGAVEDTTPATCRDCGAVRKVQHGPVIPMTRFPVDAIGQEVDLPPRIYTGGGRTVTGVGALPYFVSGH